MNGNILADMFAVVTADGRILGESITKKGAIGNAVENVYGPSYHVRTGEIHAWYDRQWAQMQAQGTRCCKVQLVEVEQ